MAILDYVKNTEDLESAEQLRLAHEQGVSSRTMLLALGDFWSDYFTDLDNLAAVTTGSTVLISEAYNKILDQVLSSTLLQIPLEQPVAYNLIVFSEEEFKVNLDGTGEVESYSIPAPNIKSLQYFVSSLFDPEVILEEGLHYALKDGEIHFYVDLFHDQDIFVNAYSLDTFQGRKILLWATNICLEESKIYERFGTYLYTRDYDTEQYRWTVTALLYFYANAKSTERIENIVNILFGLPFSRTPGEVVTGIRYVDAELNTVPDAGKATYQEIKTNWNTYFTFPYTELLVGVGDVLEDYKLLARFHYVKDYITDPDWYDGARFPYELLEDYRDPAFLAHLAEDPELVEFSQYLQEQYDGDIPYDATRRHVGTLSTTETWVGKDPFIDVKASTTGEDYERNLYDIMDNVLKYNIVYVFTQLSYETYNYWRENKAETTDLIKSGLPVYLYPLVEVVFKSVFFDSFDLGEFSSLQGSLSETKDYLTHCAYRLYNGERTYGEVVTNVYDGTMLHSGDTHYHQPGIFTYDGTADHSGLSFYNHRIYLLRHDCEDNYAKLGSWLRASDTYEWATRREVLISFDGSVGHNGDFVYDTRTEDADPSAYGGFVRLSDILSVSEKTNEDLTLKQSEVAGKSYGHVYDGTMRYSAYSVDTHSGFLEYDGVTQYDEASERSEYNGTAYDGSVNHAVYPNAVVLHNNRYCEDNYAKLRAGVHTSDTYEWATSRAVLISFDGSVGHNGDFVYDTRTEDADPSACGGFVRLSDILSVTDKTNEDFTLKQSDVVGKASGHVYDGTIRYSAYSVDTHSGFLEYDGVTQYDEYSDRSEYNGTAYDGSVNHAVYPNAVVLHNNGYGTDSFMINTYNKATGLTTVL